MNLFKDDKVRNVAAMPFFVCRQRKLKDRNHSGGVSLVLLLACKKESKTLGVSRELGRTEGRQRFFSYISFTGGEISVGVKLSKNVPKNGSCQKEIFFDL